MKQINVPLKKTKIYIVRTEAPTTHRIVKREEKIYRYKKKQKKMSL